MQFIDYFSPLFPLPWRKEKEWITYNTLVDTVLYWNRTSAAIFHYVCSALFGSMLNTTDLCFGKWSSSYFAILNDTHEFQYFFNITCGNTYMYEQYDICKLPASKQVIFFKYKIYIL